MKTRDIKIRKGLAELTMFVCVWVSSIHIVGVSFCLCVSCLNRPCSLGRIGRCCRPCGRCWRSSGRSYRKRTRGGANCSSPTPMRKLPGRSSGLRWSARSPRYRWRLSVHHHSLVEKISVAFSKVTVNMLPSSRVKSCSLQVQNNNQQQSNK